jgi:hypothetical protein
MVERVVEHEETEGTVEAEETEETLGEFLASRARRASDTLLAGHAIAAVVTAIAIAAWRGPAWDIRLCIAICFLAFGVWGIVDRDIEARESASRRVRRILETVRFTAAACGFASAGFLALSLLGRLLGKLIS